MALSFTIIVGLPHEVWYYSRLRSQMGVEEQWMLAKDAHIPDLKRFWSIEF